MKTLKENQKKKLILATIAILILGLAIVGICSNDNAMAATCPTCQTTGLSLKNAGGQHGYWCENCNVYINYADHSYNEYGVCACGASTGCYHDYQMTYAQFDSYHTFVYTCTKCSDSYTEGAEAHDFSSGSTCSKCGASHTHSYETTYNNEGEYHTIVHTCTVCGNYSTETDGHSYETTYTRTDTNHTKTYKCVCGHSYSDEAQSHSFDGSGHCECGAVNYTQGGLCEACNIGSFALKYDAEGHYFECTTCGNKLNKAAHAFSASYTKDDSNHVKTVTCSCGYSYTEGAKAHSYVNGTCECGATDSNAGNSGNSGSGDSGNSGSGNSGSGGSGSGDSGSGDGTGSGDNTECTHTYGDAFPKDVTNHAWACSLCGKEELQAHDFKLEFENEETGEHSRMCIICGYAETGLEHTYGDYEVKDETHHVRVCEGCKHEEVTEHTFGDYVDLKDGTHNRVCTVCEGTEKAAEHTYGDYTSKNDADHSRTCEVCGSEDVEEHKLGKYTSKDDVYHTATCEVCGKEDIAEHKFGEYRQLDDGTHIRVCTVCGFKDGPTKHSYGEDGECECGAVNPTEECEHEEYVVKYDTTHHWEECKKCQEVKANSKEKHTFVDGVCECGAKEPENKCKHEKYILTYNETEHWEECEKCGEEKEDTKEAHEYDKYTDNKNGTHTAECTKCDYKLTEKHNTDEDCEECGYTVDKNDDNKDDENKDDENDDNATGDKNEEDNTVVDKDIPHTGAKGIALIAILTVGAVGVLAAIKMRKYRGI